LLLIKGLSHNEIAMVRAVSERTVREDGSFKAGRNGGPPRSCRPSARGGICVVTKNFSLLEPGIFARKYYAPGIGVVLEVEPDEGKAVRLVDCNFDARCASLVP